MVPRPAAVRPAAEAKPGAEAEAERLAAEASQREAEEVAAAAAAAVADWTARLSRDAPSSHGRIPEPVLLRGWLAL